MSRARLQLAVASVVALLSAAIPGARANPEALLGALASERAQALTLQPGSDAARALPRPALEPLRGVSRARLREAIGPGDYCGKDIDCAAAQQAAYYFFKPDDSPPDRPGRLVLLVYYDDHDLITHATWYDAGVPDL